MAAPDFAREAELIAAGARHVAGVDEAGRGPLAGPVVAAAAILNPADPPHGLDDSKKLTAAARERCFDDICARALAIGLAQAPPEAIDRLNIRQASLLAMRLALAALALAPDRALVDGRDVPPDILCPAIPIIGGDGLSLSIAAASIVAKVTRDRLMLALDRSAPQWGFARHKGYPTKAHRAALARHGPSPHHRLSFALMRENANPALASKP